MKLLRVFLIFILFFVSCETNIKNNDRPQDVPIDATWDNISGTWSRGTFDEGNIQLWYKSGVLLYEEIKIKDDLKKCIQYHTNGKVDEIGFKRYFPDKYYDNDGFLIGWISIGKWKEFNDSGILIHETCYTPNYIGGEAVLKCGIEILYNDDGSVKEKKTSKYECQYGCE